MCPADQLMRVEEKGSGAVAWSIYAAYIKAAGGPLCFIINLLLFLLTTGSIAFSNWWLSHWIRQGSGVSGLLPTASVCRAIKRILQLTKVNAGNKEAEELESVLTSKCKRALELSNGDNNKIEAGMNH